MPVILFIANLFGISVIRLAIYAAIAVAVVTGALVIRQHYVNLGWAKHKAAVEKQDNKAVEAGKEVERKVKACLDNSYWDVITQSCKLDEEIQ